MLILKKLIPFLILFILTSCATNPPDVPLCTEITPARGYCIHTLSSKEYSIDDENLYEGKTWWDLRPTMIFMPSASWAKIKAFIIKVCKKHGCNGQDITSWQRTVEIIDNKVAKP